MNYRHEYKHEISVSDAIAISQRLSAVAKLDPHAVNGTYQIRSLYFDNAQDKALREKIDGVNQREKFRIRLYNGDAQTVHLEKKSKVNGLCAKESVKLSPQEARAIVSGDLNWMANCDRPLLQELYHKMRTQGLRPKTIVDYTRKPFVYGPGNVRVTLDYNLRTGLTGVDFLNPGCVTVPVRDAPILLEVKWDAYLPKIIQDAVQLPGCRAGAFSKYAACRVYG